jgi:hypothetical protein
MSDTLSGISRSAQGRTSNYVHGLHTFVDGRFATRDHIRVISITTLDDPTHTLTPGDSGDIWITGALVDGCTIKLPSGSLSGVVGTHYRISMVGVMAASISIALPNGAANGEMVGSVFATSRAVSGNIKGIIATSAAAAGNQRIVLDQNDESFGGAPGSVVELLYVSSTTVNVAARSVCDTINACDVANTTFFKTAGY